MDSLRVAAIQMCSTADRADNLARARALLEQGVAAGAELLALPENFGFLPTHEAEKREQVEDPREGPSARMLRELARAHGVWIIGGSVPLAARDPDKVTNSCLVFGPDGELAARYDKLHLFDVALDARSTFTESNTVQAGEEIVDVELAGWRVGLSLCYDLRFPELYRRLALRGASVLSIPSAFTAPTGRAHWELLVRARAVENLAFVIAPAQWGQHNPRRESFGRTLVVGPWGDILGRRDEGEGVVIADLDGETLRRERRRLQALDHVRPELFALDPDAGPER